MVGRKHVPLVAALAILASGCSATALSPVAAQREGQVSADAFGNTHILLGGRNFVLKPIDGKPVGNLAVQVAGKFYPTTNGSFGLGEAALKDLQANARGFFRVFAPGYVPTQVWIGQAGDAVPLTPILAVKVAFDMPPTGGRIEAEDKGIAVTIPNGFLAAPSTSVAISEYTPPPHTDQTAAEKRRQDFLDAVAKATPAQRELLAATNCDKPMPCPPATAGFGMMMTVNGPINAGVISSTMDLAALAKGTPDQQAASARIKQTFAQIDAMPTAATYRNVLANQYGVRLDGSVLTFAVQIGDQAVTDGYARVEVDGLDLLGVNLEFTVVSSAGGALPPAASVPALTAAAPASGPALAGAATATTTTPGLAGAPTAVQLASLIGNDGGSLISNDGGSLISNDGGSIISQDGGSLVGKLASGLIGNDGGSLISNDGGSLVGSMKVPFAPTGPAKFGLLSYQEWAWPDARVYAFGSGSYKQWVQVDSSGNFTIPATGASQKYIIVVGQAGPYRLCALAKAPGVNGREIVAIDAASTAVTLWAINQFKLGLYNQSNVNMAGYGKDVKEMRKALDQANAGQTVAKPFNLISALAAVLFTAIPRVFETLQTPAQAAAAAAAKAAAAALPPLTPPPPAATVPGSVAVGAPLAKPSLPSDRGFSDLVVNTNMVKMSIYDDWFQDGDKVDISINGTPVKTLQNLLELKDGTGYTLTLGSGVNTITVTADSTGTIGPNTLLLAFDQSQIVSGDPVQLSDNLAKGQSVSFKITVP